MKTLKKNQTKTSQQKTSEVSLAVFTAFSCASAKDVNKVTVRLKDLTALNERILTLPKGTEFILDIVDSGGKGRSQTPLKIVFTINREGSTAATNMWPHRLVNPRVGLSIMETVTKLSPATTRVIQHVRFDKSYNP
jgi:hypothetical protein